MRNRFNIFFLLGLLIPTFFVFRAIFLPGPAVWGDAPYFYPDGLKELFSISSSWTARGHNFGGFNEFLWIYPLMFIYGALHNFFGLNNDVIIRILFYIPAISLSLIGPILFTRYLGYSKVVQFFASLFYTLNTYFILLVDGGQVGVALSYGIFPLALMFAYKLLAKPSLGDFLTSLISLFALCVADVRIAAICVLTLISWMAIEGTIKRDLKLIGNIKFIGLLLLIVLGLSAYWVVPLLFAPASVAGEVSGLELTSLLNSLLVFQPHWPSNEFGKVSAPPFYFIGIPLLLSCVLIGKKVNLKKISFFFIFLIFGFLAKGTTPPLGGLYELLVTHAPFGSAFRDSTKFFIPMILFAGVLIGTNTELLVAKFKRYVRFIIVMVYAYLLFLLHPAILGNMQGVLKPRELPNDFKIIYDRLNSENGFSRTAWFPGIHPFTFQTEDKQVIDASGLIKLRPFATHNVGNDVFNFIRQGPEFLDWFNLLGIKYLVFSENTRVVNPTSEEKNSWNDLKQLVAASPGLIREDWGTSLPIYSISDVKPHIFGVDKAILVVGSEDIYEKIREASPKFSVGNQAFFFFEDGKFYSHEAYDPLTSKSAVIVFNHKDNTDLAMSFLQRYFVSPKDAKLSQWAIRDSKDYLKWKYELLTQGVDTKEFDYGKGIAFSTVIGEKIRFSFKVSESGEYIFASRELSEGRFKWNIENISLEKGKWNKEFFAKSKLDAINTVALIPKKDWDFANSQTSSLIAKLNVVRIDGVNDSRELIELSNISQWHPLEYQVISPSRYKIILPQNNSWVIFTDSFSGGWHIDTNKYYHWSSPVYSEFNSFFVHDYDKTAEVYNIDQEHLKIGEKLSIVSVAALAVILLGLYAGRRKK